MPNRQPYPAHGNSAVCAIEWNPIGGEPSQYGSFVRG
jgi:hypothetical protein